MSVAFSSAGSSDPDGTIASYAWDLDGDGAFDDSSVQNPSFTYTAAGTYTVRLQVTDNLGAQDLSDPITISAQSAGGGASYSASVLADSPLSYWRLGEASGTTAADSSGANRTGSYLNTPTLGVPGALAGDTNTPVGFNGTNEYVHVPFAAALNPASFTVEAWAYVTGGQDTYRSLVTSRDFVGGVASGYILYAGANNNWQLWTGNGSWNVLRGPPSPSISGRTSSAATTGPPTRLYVNGTLADSRLPATCRTSAPAADRERRHRRRRRSTSCPDAWTRLRCTGARFGRTRSAHFTAASSAGSGRPMPMSSPRRLHRRRARMELSTSRPPPSLLESG